MSITKRKLIGQSKSSRTYSRKWRTRTPSGGYIQESFITEPLGKFSRFSKGSPNRNVGVFLFPEVVSPGFRGILFCIMPNKFSCSDQDDSMMSVIKKK
jgi:hypothetical protein